MRENVLDGSEPAAEPARILVLTRYDRLGASSRVRFLQFLPELGRLAGRRVAFQVEPFFSDDYLRDLYRGRGRRLGPVIGAYLRRLAVVAKMGSFDLIWLEKEVLPYVPAIVEQAMLPRGVPIVVDFDDAIFVQYGRHPSRLVRWALGNKIDQVCAGAHTVVAGNEFLAEHARRAGASRVTVIPTTIDGASYQQTARSRPRQEFHIGWIGTPVTAKYLRRFAPALVRLTAEPDTYLVTIGAAGTAAPGARQIANPWLEGEEVRMLTECDAAVAPLDDGPWEKGKCGYTIIQCMAAGLPVVASPVGVANSIIEHGVNGFLAENDSECEAILRKLKHDGALRQRVGQKARQTALSGFAIEKWRGVLRDVLAAALADDRNSAREGR